MLDNVHFRLKDRARSWFKNHEATLTLWVLSQQEAEEHLLATIAKKALKIPCEHGFSSPTKQLTSSLEEVVRLLRPADPNTTEERKIPFLIHGVKEEIFNTTIRDPSSTVSDFVTTATRIERATSSVKPP